MSNNDTAFNFIIPRGADAHLLPLIAHAVLSAFQIIRGHFGLPGDPDDWSGPLWLDVMVSEDGVRIEPLKCHFSDNPIIFFFIVVRLDERFDMAAETANSFLVATTQHGPQVLDDLQVKSKSISETLHTRKSPPQGGSDREGG
jgi:hypothetical protein